MLSHKIKCKLSSRQNFPGEGRDLYHGFGKWQQVIRRRSPMP
jgi:hypothetical protein